MILRSTAVGLSRDEKVVLVQKVMADQGRSLVTPSIVAIYERRNGSDHLTHQIGTGFLISDHERPVLIAAKHALFGHEGNIDPWERQIMFNGLLRPLNELKTDEICSDNTNDLCAVYVDELGLSRCLNNSVLLDGEATCGLVAIHGFLARDFRREIKLGRLSPKPFFYVSPRRSHTAGYVSVDYPKSKNRDTITGKRVISPRPVGMSGCPMLDALRLAKGEVSVIGVFTEQRGGGALGESSSKVIRLLAQM